MLNEYTKVTSIMRQDLSGLPVVLDADSFRFKYVTEQLPEGAYYFSHVLAVLTDAINAAIFHKSNFSTTFEILDFSVNFLTHQMNLNRLAVEIEVLRNDKCYACLCAYLYSDERLSAISNANFTY